MFERAMLRTGAVSFAVGLFAAGASSRTYPDSSRWSCSECEC